MSYGYDLSWQVIDGILKHTDMPIDDCNENALLFQLNHSFFYSNSLKNVLNYLAKKDGYLKYPFPLTLEGQIVKIADEIAQYYHDILDFSRYFKDENVMDDFFNEINKIEFDENIYVLKFRNTFKTKMKLYDEDNREFLANEIKELFINDVVYTINSKKDIRKEYIDKERFVVENILFKECDSKVFPIFNSTFVTKVSNIFNKKRKSYISCSNGNIKKYDQIGQKNIEKVIIKLRNNKRLFIKYCGKDIIQYLKRVFDISKISKLTINNVEIHKFNIDKNKRIIVDGIYSYGKYGKECIYASNKLKKYIRQIFDGVVIEATARMTDHFILDKKYRKI